MRSELAIFGLSSFRDLYLARSISLIGSAMAPLALTFGILDVPGWSAAQLGLVLAARTGAILLFLVIGGTLADRLSRKRLMVMSDLIAFVAESALALLILFRVGSLAGLVIASVVAGSAEAIFGPASRGITPEVVPDSLRQTANGLLRISRSTTAIVGAPLAALLVATLGPGYALLINALTFLLSACLMSRLPASNAVGGGGGPGLVRDLRDGWEEFRSRQWVWIVVAQFAVINLCFAPSVYVLGPILSKQYMGGPTQWSLILAAQSIGLVAGGLLAIRLRPSRPMRMATAATFGFILPPLLLAIEAPIWTVALGFCLNGICVDIFEVLWETSLQKHVPQQSLSRVGSYDMLGSYTLNPLGMAIIGPLSVAINAKPTLILAGGLMALASALALAAPSVRNLQAVLSEDVSGEPGDARTSTIDSDLNMDGR